MSEHTRPFSRRAFVGGAAAFGISLCLPPLMPAKAHAVTAAEKQAEANAALEKLNAMQEKLDRAEVSLYAAETERDDAQARMDEAQGRIDSASSRISELQDKLGNRARSMYRSGSSTFLDLLLGATTFQAFASNWDLLNDMNQNDADMVEETKTLRSEVESEKAVYEEQRNVAAQKAEEAEAVKKEAESLVSQMEETYNSLSEEAAQLLFKRKILIAFARHIATHYPSRAYFKLIKIALGITGQIRRKDVIQFLGGMLMNIIHGLLMRIGLKIYLAQVLVKLRQRHLYGGLHRIYKHW